MHKPYHITKSPIIIHRNHHSGAYANSERDLLRTRKFAHKRNIDAIEKLWYKQKRFLL